MPLIPRRRNKNKKAALITGITGQDGSYLTEFLLSKGYEVHGIIRRASTLNTERIDHIYVDPHEENAKFLLYNADVTSSEYLYDIIYNIKPDELYNLAAQSHVRVSFDLPEYTANVNSLGTVRLLQSVYNSGNDCKFYQASTSELFGNTTSPQNEETKFDPASPYAISKLYSFYIVKGYREWHNMFAVNGILFNHESPRRGATFVTKKITTGIANIMAKRQKYIFLGNINTKRDWGYAPEYVEVMWKMMQQEKPEDYVIGTGESHSVMEFLERAFAYVGMNWEEHVKIDETYKRPKDVDNLVADPSKAKRKLGWYPKVRFGELVKIMVDADLRKVGIAPPGEGDEILRKLFPDRWWGVD